ncbi:hypothetical protein BC835DRAFT_1303577 [Cytidiella melzeri]|nr:hypothetical protein BC835DRAFT_1303577 [Cytidiella melzeri]
MADMNSHTFSEWPQRYCSGGTWHWTTTLNRVHRPPQVIFCHLQVERTSVVEASQSNNRHARDLKAFYVYLYRGEFEMKRLYSLEELNHPDAKISEMNRPFSRLAAVYTLPDEVLLEILEAAYAHEFPYCRNHEPSAEHSPLAFSHVSRRFRRVALASTKVWTCLHISLGQPESYTRVLQAHLAHSKGQPLSFTFRYLLAPPYDTPTEEAWVQYDLCRFRARLSWRMVHDHHHRWKNLAMFFASMDPIVPFMEDLAQVDFHLLESMYIWVDKRCAAEPLYEDGLQLDFRAPLLTKLSLCAEIFDVGCPLAIQNVTRLALCHMWKLTIMDVAATLSFCAPSLTYLEITGDCIFEAEEEGLRRVRLPNLRHLLIHSATDEAWYPLLALLDAPHLETLAVEDEESLNGFVEAIEHGAQLFPNVRYLSISHTEESSPQKLRRTTARFIWAFPSLVHLRIKTKTNKYRIMRQILGANLRPANPGDAGDIPLPKPWPNLRSLTLESAEIDEAALQEFAYQQRGSTGTFAQLHLRSSGDKPISARTEEYFEKMGLTVDFTNEISCSRFDAYNWHSSEFIPWETPVVEW